MVGCRERLRKRSRVLNAWRVHFLDRVLVFFFGDTTVRSLKWRSPTLYTPNALHHELCALGTSHAHRTGCRFDQEAKLFEAVVSWGETAKPGLDAQQLRQYLDPLLRHVAYAKMTPAELRQVVKGARVISLEEYLAIFEASVC